MNTSIEMYVVQHEDEQEMLHNHFYYMEGNTINGAHMVSKKYDKLYQIVTSENGYVDSDYDFYRNFILCLGGGDLVIWEENSIGERHQVKYEIL